VQRGDIESKLLETHPTLGNGMCIFYFIDLNSFFFSSYPTATTLFALLVLTRLAVEQLIIYAPWSFRPETLPHGIYMVVAVFWLTSESISKKVSSVFGSPPAAPRPTAINFELGTYCRNLRGISEI